MKRVINILHMMIISFAAYAQLQQVVTVGVEGDFEVSFLTSKVDTIKYFSDGNKYLQEIWSLGVDYSMELSKDAFMDFKYIDTLSVISINGIDVWEEIHMTVDGSMVMQKKNNIHDTWKDVFMLLPNEEFGNYIYCVVLDEKDVPKYITIDDCIILVDRYDEETIDLTIAYNDTISQSFRDLKWENNSTSMTRAFIENNWQRNTSAIVELLVGTVGVAVGSGLIASSIISEIGTYGSSTPISIPGIIQGYSTIVGGCMTFKDGFEALWKPGEPSSHLSESVAQQAVTTALLNNRTIGFIPNEYFAYLKEPNKGLSNMSNFLSYAGIFVGIFDNVYGKTITWNDLKEFYNDKVTTGRNTSISNNFATLKGYVDPAITISPIDGSKFENEYGIILKSEKDGTVVKKIHNGEGGLFEFSFDNLTEDTNYIYMAYYYDRTNAIFVQGECLNFKTPSILPKITNFEQTACFHSPFSIFENDGVNYNTKFEVATTVEINSLDGVSDWGYVYKDLFGTPKHISLLEFGTSYTDTRYAYYRYEKNSTVCLYGYVKYEGSDNYLYDEPCYYPLEYVVHLCPDANHPHAIDLGLPSGNKWCCMNVGAISPEENGGHYAWGEVNEKSEYTWETYIYGDSWSCQDIGSNISGTSYDVAKEIMGDSWRMPTNTQMSELLDKCIFDFYYENGAKYWLFTGPNGNSIILPLAGGNNKRDKQDGYYWSSSLDTTNRTRAYYMHLYRDYSIHFYDQNRYNGYSVRAIGQ